MNYDLLESNTENFVTHIYQSPDKVQYAYHNLTHTRRVVDHVKDMTAFYSLPEYNGYTLILAAWFHDIGQIYGVMDGHEQRSAVIMTDYLSANNVANDFITEVASLIMVTRQDAFAHTIQEKIMCDADTWHFGTPLFRETEFQVKEEMECRTARKYLDWHRKSLTLLQSHVYYTEYTQLLLNKGKMDNINWLKTLIATDPL